MIYSTDAGSARADQSSDYVQGLVYQLADLAHLLSILKQYVPLTQIKDKCDPMILMRLREQSMQDDLCSILKTRLDGDCVDPDISTALHYMVLVSLEEKFGIDFQKLNVYGIIRCFNHCEAQFNIPVDMYQAQELDQDVLYNLACFEFIQHYKESFKFIFPDNFRKIFCNEQMRIYIKLIPTQNFLMSTKTEDVVHTLQYINQLIYLIECLLKAIKEYKMISKQSIKLDLQQLSGMIMYLAIQLSEFVEYTDFMRQFHASHIVSIQRIINCLEYLWSINPKYIQPISLSDSTPLSSPQGRLVTYNQGLIPCLLEMYYKVMKLDTKRDCYELGLVSNLLRRIIKNERENEIQIHHVVQRSKQDVSSKLTCICNYLNQKSVSERTDYSNICSQYADILVAFTQARIFLSFQSIMQFLGGFALGNKGTKQLKQKCLYLLSQLQPKADTQVQELQAKYSYQFGQDKYIDYVLVKKQEQPYNFTE